MARDFARAFYHTKAWKKARDDYMSQPVDIPGAGTCPPLMCERCFARGILKPAEIVHHVVWLTPDNIDDRQVALDPANLQRVCRDCHAEIHEDSYRQRRHPARDYGFEPRVRFGPDGEVLPLDDGGEG